MNALSIAFSAGKSDRLIHLMNRPQALQDRRPACGPTPGPSCFAVHPHEGQGSKPCNFVG